MWPFRRSRTTQDRSERHDTVLDLIEQVTALRGSLRAVESEWDDMRAQITKGYRRMEKAHERSLKAQEPCREEDPVDGLAHGDQIPMPLTFADKYRAMRK